MLVNYIISFYLVGALQGVQLSQLHQQSYWCTIAWLVHCKGVQLSQLHQQSCWAAAWLVHYKGVQLSPLGFAACQSKNCTNRVGALLLGWCTTAWLVHLRQVHPLVLLHEQLLYLAVGCAHDVDATLEVLYAYSAEVVYLDVGVVVGSG